MNIKPGMFIQYGTLGIEFEVKEVFSDFVICAARNPKDETELVWIKDINYCVDEPDSTQWIKLNREKSFYDKFHPEGWQPTITKVISFNEIKEGMKIITEKGVCETTRRVGNTWHLKGAKKTFTSKNSDTYVTQLIQVEGKKKG